MQSTDVHIDESLLQRAREGDRHAHAALYRAFAPMVFTVAYRMLGSRATAEDVLQDSFVEVIRKAGDFRGGAATQEDATGNGSIKIRGWIKRIAINKCLSHLRSPWVARQESSREHGPDLSDADDEFKRIGQRQALERALATLSATARAVVWMHDVEGYTHQEIGRMMGRSTSFSKTQLSRAHTRLRELLHLSGSDQEAEPCLGVLKTV